MAVIQRYDKSSIIICPITLKYRQPVGFDPDFFGWWGDMSLIKNIVRVVAFGTSGRLEVLFHNTIDASLIRDRKKIASLAEDMVRGGLDDSITKKKSKKSRC